MGVVSLKVNERTVLITLPTSYTPTYLAVEFQGFKAGIYTFASAYLHRHRVSLTK